MYFRIPYFLFLFFDVIFIKSISQKLFFDEINFKSFLKNN